MSDTNITSKVVLITPQIAKQMLMDNIGNRPLRRNHINRLAASMKRGDWRLTHQGVAYASDGRLIDGQHRLHAVIEANTPVMMMVTFGVDDFVAIDRGAARSLADLTGLPKKLAESAKISASFINISSPEEILQLANGKFGSLHESLISATPLTAKLFTTAPIRAGFVIAIMAGADRGDTMYQYNEMAHQRFSNLSSGVEALVRQLISGKAKASGRDLSRDLLMRAFKAPFLSSASRISLDPFATSEKIKFILLQSIKGARDAE